MQVLLIVPSQLYWPHPGLFRKPDRILLVEDSLFFGDAHAQPIMHKQKIWLHRASMQRFRGHLEQTGHSVQYCDYKGSNHGIDKHLIELLHGEDNVVINVCETHDYLLERRLRRVCHRHGWTLNQLPSPGFLNSAIENQDYRKEHRRWFMADFYRWQRRRLEVLMDGDDPVGGQWSYDEDNRKKVPKRLLENLPMLPKCKRDAIDRDAVQYVNRQFPNALGSIDQLIYPTSHGAASEWLRQFLEDRFQNFGIYEDAIVEGQSWLWHSVLTPMLNIGLLTPRQILDETLKFAASNDIPINSVEGFLRQIIGWREFVRATYDDIGVAMRTTNHWGHQAPMPTGYYDATTGIEPIDDAIRRVLATGYCHHIERLMVLGGFMFLCEIHPHHIYRWFMEMFVDSYDWVMVPNVYGMSQHADGGLITTKPYFCGSAYVRRMSNHPPGPWCEIWDGLYWRWIHLHRKSLCHNPRWAMMCKMADRMNEAVMQQHLKTGEKFLAAIRRQ